MNKLLWPFLLILFILLLISTFSESLTYDELTHLNVGYEILKNHEFRYDIFNPPLTKEIFSFPSLFNKNLVINNLILFYPRLITIFFTLGLGFIVYKFSESLYGKSSAILALFFFILEPNILANGHYVTTDLIFTFFYIFCIWIFYLWKNRFTTKRIILFSFLVGLLLSTKFTALMFFFIPISFLYILNHNSKTITYFFKKKFISLLLFMSICFISLWGTYFFKFKPFIESFASDGKIANIAKHNNIVKFALDIPMPLGDYFYSIKESLFLNYSDMYTRISMIFGNFSYDGQSGYLFIPLIFIKTPFPLLLIFIFCLILLRKNIRKDAILLVPIMSILFVALAAKTMIVFRYILPIIPLLIIYASQFIAGKSIKGNLKKALLIIILFWYLLESFSSFPHYISYVNLALGGTKSGYKYVFDANYDWGQGLIGLKKFQERNKDKKLQLAYFGNISPSKYGINYERLKTYSTPTDNKPEGKLRIDKDTIVAISGTCWYLCGHKNNPFLKDREPSEIIGGSILIFR